MRRRNGDRAHIDNAPLTRAAGLSVRRQAVHNQVEDTLLKGLYALAFVLSSFAACAQTPDAAPMMPSDLNDYFGEVTELGTLSPPVAGEPTIAKPGEALGATDGTDDAPVAAIEPSNDTASVTAPIWWDDNLSCEEATEPGTVPAQVAPEPTAETLREASANGDSAAIAEAADVPTGRIEPRHEEAATDPGTVPAQIDPEPTAETLREASANGDSVAVAEAADAPASGIEPRHEEAATSPSPSEDEVMVGDTIGQSEWLP